MQITGRIIEVLPLKSGTSQRGEWYSQQYVLETVETYPKRLLFDVFGREKIDQFNVQKNDFVKVSFNPEAHEHNGVWFCSNRAWDIVKETSTL